MIKYTADMEQSLRELILKELPALITQDPQIRDWVWHLVHEYAPSRIETESRFEQMLAELQRMRADFQAEMRAMHAEFQAEMRAMRADFQAEMRAMREEQQQRWEENQQQIREMLREIQRVDHRIDHTIGALGARWGVATEATFRKALRGILEDTFGVKVERVEYKDASGEVFGRPDIVELDILIRDGEVLVCELKSSTSRSDVYTFERKVRFYEKRSGRKVHRALLISPIMLDQDRELARSLGIEVYSDAEEVKPSPQANER